MPRTHSLEREMRSASDPTRYAFEVDYVGTKRSGVVEAESPEILRRRLVEQGFTVVRIEEVTPATLKRQAMEERSLAIRSVFLIAAVLLAFGFVLHLLMEMAVPGFSGFRLYG